MSLRIGFVGFGEAGSHIAQGLRGAGVTQLAAYDIQARDATPAGETIRQRALTSGVALAGSSAALAADADIIFSVVTASSAEQAAGQTAPHLGSRHYYADLNSVSPGTKQRIGEAIAAAGGRFVEVAVMAPVPPYLHKAPMLANGPHAAAFAEKLGPLGMRFQVIDDRPGVAAATKMCRSVIVKGIESLVMESMLASTYYGADERVWESLNETFPGMDWKKLADYVVGRVAVHGERRAREMEEVATTLEEAQVDPTMTRAVVERMDWSVTVGMRPQWGAAGPKTYAEVASFVRQVTPPELPAEAAVAKT
jgi:3-hydroxyisobutyrate dehydrogenase-like beta-hydroxyacid dehydrogenase